MYKESSIGVKKYKQNWTIDNFSVTLLSTESIEFGDN